MTKSQYQVFYNYFGKLRWLPIEGIFAKMRVRGQMEVCLFLFNVKKKWSLYNA